MKTVMFLVMSVLMVIFSGCSTKIPVVKESGHLNLEYNSPKEKNDSPKLIALIKPAMKDMHIEKKTKQVVNPFTGMSMNVGGLNHSVDFNGLFVDNYMSDLSNAMEEEFEEMLTNKGFKLIGPFESLDELSYSDKKKVYLAVIPKLELNFKKFPTDINKKHDLVYSEKGTVRLDGSFKLSYMEPLTRERIMSRRINLSDFKISKTYTREVQTRSSSGGLTSSMIDNATAPDSLKDDTDKVITQMINEFFKKSMDKINRFTSVEEINSYEPDILKLKGLKRF